MFIIVPLAEKLGGIEAVLALDIPEALNYRDAISERSEFEEYYMWVADQRRKIKAEQGEGSQDGPHENALRETFNKAKSSWEPNDGQVMKLLRPPERDKAKVERALDSVQAYTLFLSGRGFNSGKGMVTGS